jgi:hypothetical protein
MEIDRTTGKVTAKPPAGISEIQVRFKIIDPDGETRMLDVKLKFNQGLKPDQSSWNGFGRQLNQLASLNNKVDDLVLQALMGRS